MTTATTTPMARRLHERVSVLRSVEREPGARRSECGVDILDVLDTFGLEPGTKRGRALLRIDRDAVLPRRAAAQDTCIPHARLARQCERLRELGVAHACRKIDERLGGRLRSLEEELLGLVAIVRALAGEDLRPLDALH